MVLVLDRRRWRYVHSFLGVECLRYVEGEFVVCAVQRSSEFGSRFTANEAIHDSSDSNNIHGTHFKVDFEVLRERHYATLKIINIHREINFDLGHTWVHRAADGKAWIFFFLISLEICQVESAEEKKITNSKIQWAFVFFDFLFFYRHHDRVKRTTTLDIKNNKLRKRDIFVMRDIQGLAQLKIAIWTFFFIFFFFWQWRSKSSPRSKLGMMQIDIECTNSWMSEHFARCDGFSNRSDAVMMMF